MKTNLWNLSSHFALFIQADVNNRVLQLGQEKIPKIADIDLDALNHFLKNDWGNENITRNEHIRGLLLL